MHYFYLRIYGRSGFVNYSDNFRSISVNFFHVKKEKEKQIIGISYLDLATKTGLSFAGLNCFFNGVTSMILFLHFTAHEFKLYL